MANPLLGQILGAAIGSAMRGRARTGPYGRGDATSGLGGAALGGVLGGLMRGRGTRGGSRGLLLAMMLPFAMRWVQRNGGLNGVLDKLRSKGFGNEASSWVARGDNHTVPAQAMDDIVGRAELARIAQHLGYSEQEVAEGFAEILPEVTDQLTPDGHVPPEADDALEGGSSELEKALREVKPDVQLA